jgi:hypothetical protein
MGRSYRCFTHHCGSGPCPRLRFRPKSPHFRITPHEPTISTQLHRRHLLWSCERVIGGFFLGFGGLATAAIARAHGALPQVDRPLSCRSGPCPRSRSGSCAPIVSVQLSRNRTYTAPSPPSAGRAGTNARTTSMCRSQRLTPRFRTGPRSPDPSPLPWIIRTHS